MKRRTRKNPLATARDLGTFSIVDGEDEGTIHVTLNGEIVSPALPGTATTWGGVGGKPAVMGVGATEEDARAAISAVGAEDLRRTVGVVTLADDGATDNLAALHAALATYKHVQVAPSASGNGVLGIIGTCTIPESTTLVVHEALTVKILSGNSESAFRVMDGANLIVNGVVDGNLTARELSGDLATFVWACRSTDVSNTFVDISVVRDVGATAAYIAGNSGESDGGGCVINHSSSAVKHTENNRQRVRKIEGDKHGFMMRIRSDFLNVAEGESSYYNQNNEIWAPHGPGGSKNVVECVGPHTRNNHIYGGVAIDPTGQGGYEQDIGAYNNTFHNPVIRFTQPLTRTIDCFNNRTVDMGDSKPKVTRGGRFLNPKVIIETPSLLPANMILRVCTVWNTGTDVRFDDVEVQGSAVGSGTGYAALLVLNGGINKIDRVELNRPRVENIQQGLRVTNASVGAVAIEGGYVKYTQSGTAIASGLTLDHLLTRGVTMEGTGTALAMDGVWVTDVLGCTFIGQTAHTITPPVADGSVLRFGYNEFRCGGASNRPVSSSSAAAGYLVDLGGNVYTVRVPGGATSGSNGRIRASGANVRRGGTLSLAEQQAIARRTSTPIAGTWHQGDRWDQSTPAPGGEIGGVCTEGGTYGTYSSTASTTSGSPTITVASASGLRVGDWISVAGAVTRSRVIQIVGTTVTISGNAGSTVTGAAAAHVAPTWKSLGNVAS